MGELNERNLKNVVPEAADDTEILKTAEENETSETAQADALTERERASSKESASEEIKPVEKKKGKKKRRRRGVAVPVTAVLLVLALLFGAVLGYAVGRGVGGRRLEEARALITELSAALEEASAAPTYDVFEEELTDENRAALENLSGSAFLADNGDATFLMGEDSLIAADETTAEAPVVVAEYNGGQIMSDEAAREYSEQMAGFIFDGYSEEEIADILLDEVLRYMVSDRVLEAHAKEMGIYELTDEDRAQIEAEAVENYGEQMEFYRGFVDTKGMTEEEANGAVKAYMQESVGVTLDGLTAELENGWWMQKIYDEMTKDVSVSDAEVQAAYDELLARQKESFEAYPDDFEFAQRNGEIIVYNLSGYRAVRMLLFGFDDLQDGEEAAALLDELKELNPETAAEQIAEYQARLEEIFASLQTRAQEALNELQTGADFCELMERLGEDEGMTDAALREKGYYVSVDSPLWSQEVISAAMALENAGDISGMVRTADGVCILQYVGEVPAGEVALEEVRAELAQETLEGKRYSAYENQLEQWLEEADAVYYPERMQ